MRLKDRVDRAREQADREYEELLEDFLGLVDALEELQEGCAGLVKSHRRGERLYSELRRVRDELTGPEVSGPPRAPDATAGESVDQELVDRLRGTGESEEDGSTQEDAA